GHEPRAGHRGHRRVVARPRHRAPRQDVAVGVPQGRAELHRLARRHARRRRADGHRRDRHAAHGDARRAALPFTRRRDRHRPTGPPGPTPLTSPLPFTLAIALLLDCQVITRPVNGLPFASRGVAVSCTVCPCSTLTEAGLTVTEATGTVGTIFTR